MNFLNLAISCLKSTEAEINKTMLFSKKKNRHTIHRLPEDMLLKVFDSIETPKEVAKIKKTCKYWNSLCSDINTPVHLFRLFQLYSNLPNLIWPDVTTCTIATSALDAPEHPVFSYKVCLVKDSRTLRMTVTTIKFGELIQNNKFSVKGPKEKIISIFCEHTLTSHIFSPNFNQEKIRTIGLEVVSDPAILKNFEITEVSTFDQLALASIHQFINERIQKEIGKSAKVKMTNHLL